MSLDKRYYTLHIYVPVWFVHIPQQMFLYLYNLCPSLNIAVYVAGKAATRLRDCSAATIARHLSSEEEVHPTCHYPTTWGPS